MNILKKQPDSAARSNAALPYPDFRISTAMRRIGFFIALIPAILSPNSQALEQELGNALQTVGGIYGSIWIHEAGHALALGAFGATEIRIKVPREDRLFSGETLARHPDGGYLPWQAQSIAASGLLAANLAGEIVIGCKSLHGSRFAQSILGASLISNAIHVYTYYSRRVGIDGYRGNDIDAFEAGGGNPHLFSAALVGYSLWSLERMRQRKIPLFYVNLRF